MTADRLTPQERTVTNAELIAVIRHAHKECEGCTVNELADALEAAEAQVARQEALISEILQCSVLSGSMKYMEAVGLVLDRYYGESKRPAWPADLLEAVRKIAGTRHRVHNPCSAECEAEDIAAREILARYGLLAVIAQSVEQSPCKRQAESSSPSDGSTNPMPAAPVEDAP